MVDVNKILNINNEEEKEEVKIINKEVPIIEQIFELNRTLKEFINLVDTAIKRKIPYTQVKYNGNNGLSLIYTSELYHKKIKNFGLKSTIKKLDKIIDNNNFKNILTNLITDGDKYTKLEYRLLYYADENYVGFNSTNNTIFINYENDETKILIFNLLPIELTELEQSILDSKKELEFENIEQVDNSDENGIDIDNTEGESTEKEEEKENLDFLKTLDDVDELINKYKI